MSTYVKDLLERSGFTLLQVLLGIGITELANIDLWWAAPIAGALAIAKGWVAKRVGDKDSASLLPSLSVSERK